ncbi:replication initiation factor domain-containing protein [Aeromonas veronii]|uniref:replication initiation factor domain-containing protein n=1 Tax=Aeromonas veronii TaxID=654 RepID=UPI0018F13253|nr:replication initiation factor domain-containing protein [Aeromonas veronii]MBJ7583100.1 replication initiation factor domain-containing protein [Aeromonas veronii]
MTGHNAQLVKHDFLSFTWSPEVIKRIAGLAKQGAILKSIPVFDKHTHHLLSRIKPLPTEKGLIYVRPVPSRDDPRSLVDVSIPNAAVEGARAVLTASMYEAMETNIRRGYKDDANRRLNKELKAVLGHLVDASELELNPEGTIWDAYNDLIHAYGIQFLDSLCCSELEIFFDELNHQIGVPIPAPRFAIRPRRGGVHGYSCSGDILVDGIPAGLVAWGAANHGCFVSFSGQGCDALDFGALHRVLVRIPGVRITRVDLALDDYLGKFISYGSAVEAAKSGGFHPQRGMAPKWMKIEAGEFELIPEVVKGLTKRFGMIANAGCSLYIGSRINGKCGRMYEKGKQLSSVEFPDWVRAEGELHSKDRVIPLDVLINPDPYFAGLYPQFAVWLQQLSEASKPVEPVRVTTFKNKFALSRDNAIANMARLAGRVVNYMSTVEGLKPESIIKQLTSHLSPDDVPSRLLMPLPPEILDGTCSLFLVPKPEGLLTGEYSHV